MARLNEKDHRHAQYILASGNVMSTKTPNLYGKPGGPGGTFNNDLSESEFNKKFKDGVFAGKYQTIVNAAHKHDVPASLVASIMGFETGWGKSDKSQPPFNNPAGIMAGGKGNREHKKFDTLDEGIDAAVGVQKRIHKEGGETIPGMAAIYAPVKPDGSPVANDPHGTNKQWPGTVASLQKQLQAYSGPEEGAGKGLRLDPVQMAQKAQPEPQQIPDPTESNLLGTAEKPGPYRAIANIRTNENWQKMLAAHKSINIEDRRQEQLDNELLREVHRFDPYTGKPKIDVRTGKPYEQPTDTPHDWRSPKGERSILRGFGGRRGGKAQKIDEGSELDSATPKVNGNGKLDVDVKAPTGISVKAEGEGLFNKTETNRTNINQLEPVL